MTSSPSTVISEGFGSWGSVNLLLTDGFGSGSAPPPTPGGLVCGVITIRPAVAATAVMISPRATGTAAVEQC